MPAPRGLVQHLDQSLHRSALLPRHARLLIAVSGGADSVALLRLLHAINRSDYWHWTLLVAHIDHGIRGPASHADARFVAALARQLHLPCITKRLRLTPNTSEDAARQARFRALSQICKTRRCAGVVMAHHADDQAETLLMRIFRGTGIDGLAGIAPRSQIAGMTLFRPLLTLRRQALRQYLHSLPQDWREDASNASGQYLRNRLRRLLMPGIEVLWPHAVDALGRLASLAAESHDFLHAAARRAMADIPAYRHHHTLQIPRDSLTRLPTALASEILRQIISALARTPAADFQRLREALRLLSNPHGAKTIQLGAGITATLKGPLIQFTRTTTPRS